MMLEGDALAQLPHRLVGELLVEFWLAEQDHLREFSFFRFEIGQQAQSFQRLQRHRLRFVQADYHALPVMREFEQREVQRLVQAVLIEIGIHLDMQLVAQRQQQRARFQVGIRNIGGDATVGQGGEEFSAQQRLACAHFAGDLDETLAVGHGHQQCIQPFLAAGAGEEKAGVRRDAEGRLAQAEIIEVYHCFRSAGLGRGSSPMPCMRPRLSCMSRSEFLSLWMMVGLIRMTSSLLVVPVAELRKAPPISGASSRPGMPLRELSNCTFISPPSTTMLPSVVRTIVSDSLTSILATVML